MKKLGSFLLYLAGLLLSSFILLGVLVSSMSALPGTLLWMIGTGLLAAFAFKKWKKGQVSATKEGWQGWEKVQKDNIPLSSDALNIPATEDDGFDKRPWTERSDILWSGKRKASIVYSDRNGDTTTRDITIYGIMPNRHGELTLRAKCHSKGDWRTFYIDRVIEITTARNKSYSDFSDYMATELKL